MLADKILDNKGEFEAYFQAPLLSFMDKPCSYIGDDFILDEVLFSDYLKYKFNYKPKEHGRVNDFIAVTFGEKALEIYDTLVGIKDVEHSKG